MKSRVLLFDRCWRVSCTKQKKKNEQWILDERKKDSSSHSVNLFRVSRKVCSSARHNLSSSITLSYVRRICHIRKFWHISSCCDVCDKAVDVSFGINLTIRNNEISNYWPIHLGPYHPKSVTLHFNGDEFFIFVHQTRNGLTKLNAG